MDQSLLMGTAVSIAVFLVVTLAIRKTWRVPDWFDPLVALTRAIFQLALLSLVLSVVITNLWLVVLTLGIMLGFGIWSATRRIRRTWSTALLVGVGMLTGAVGTLIVAFASGALTLTGQNLLAYGGILIGNAMSVVTLAGRRFAQDLNDRWGEVEGWLGLGATPHQSVRTLISRALSEALVPTVDQTRVTGIVTMPGAFVGAVFAGASPLEAGRFQLMVLAGVLMAGTVSAAVVLRALDPIALRADSKTRKEHAT